MNYVREWNLEGILPSQIPFGELGSSIQKQTVSRRTFFSLKCTNPLNYLASVESYIPKQLISSQNYAEIKTLASRLTGNITSFFGFETQLNTLDGRSDYLFAVSSKKGEREALLDLIQKKKLPETFLKQSEWQRVGMFVKTWTDTSSVLHDKVLGLWFEFDTAQYSSEAPIPCIFIQTIPLRIENPNDINKCDWLIHDALPLLTGQPLSEKMEKRLLHAIQQIPEGSSLIHAGIMLSRTTYGVRIVLNKMNSTQIIPYLKAIGWNNENDELSKLTKELEHYVSRFVLHIGITEDGVDPKVGIECSFDHDHYNLETRWSNFFDYLIKKRLCVPEKKTVLLNFLGVEQEDANHEFSLDSYMTAAKIPGSNFSSALVRFISHVKICYKPNHPLEVKAYPGVRLFGIPQTPLNNQYQ